MRDIQDFRSFYETFVRIESTMEFIKNTGNLDEMVAQAKYVQTAMSKFSNLAELTKELEVIRNYIYTTKDMLTLEEAADYLGVSKSYVYHMSSNNEITTYKPKGRLVYIERKDLDDWIRKYKFEPIIKARGLGLLKAEELNKKHKLG